jgi:hypothetical protein
MPNANVAFITGVGRVVFIIEEVELSIDMVSCCANTSCIPVIKVNTRFDEITTE